MTDFVGMNGTKSPLMSGWRSLGVRRYHTQGDVAVQNLADHSGRVALLLMMIWPNARPQLTQAAVTHDIGEKATGDLPYYVKKELPPEVMDAIDELDQRYVREHLKLPDFNLEPHEKAMVKICDYLELMIYCDEQPQTRGARHIAKTGASLIGVMAKLLRPEDLKALQTALDDDFLSSIQNMETFLTLKQSFAWMTDAASA